MEKQPHLPYRLFQRGGIWHAYYSFIDATGKRIQFRETTGRRSREEAESAAIKRVAEVSQKKTEDGRINYTIDEAFAKYYAEKGRYLTRPENILARLKTLKELLGVGYLYEIDELAVNRFINAKRGKISDSTINRYLSLLGVIIKTAAEDWKGKTYPIRIGKFKLKEPAENIKYLKDWETAQRIIDKAAPHLKPIIYTALYTGLRLGNLLSLKWQDIDFINKTITVKVKDKTKEGGRVHTIPIIPKLEIILKGLERPGEYVFTFKGHKISGISSSWRNIFYKRNNKYGYTHELKDATLPYVNFHTLRHTAATWILKATGDLRTTKEILGHADIKTTLKYAHVLDEAKRQALNKTFDF